MDTNQLPQGHDSNHPLVSQEFSRKDDDKIFVAIEDSPNLSVWTDDEDKIVSWDNGKQVCWRHEEKEAVRPEKDFKEFYDPSQAHTPYPDNVKRRRICGIRRRWFYTVLFLILGFLAVGLGAGLGVGLTHSHKSTHPSTKTNATSDYNIGGSLSSVFYAETGAFNGSGIALNSQTIGIGSDSDLILYYQHFEGTIRYMRLHDDDWSGGTASETVADDAKNNTPISATSYSKNGSYEWHVFYIDKNNQIRERVNSNLTTFWSDGALANTPLHTFDADQVGMSACLYGSVFNDSDYANRTLTGAAAQIGIHLRYVSDNQTLKQYGWRDGDEEWDFQRQWTDIDPHAGIGCNSFGLDTVDYIMLANQEHEIEVWGKDISSEANGWENMTPSSSADGVDFSKVHPSTSFAYNELFYAQDSESSLIRAYNVSWAGSNTTIAQASELKGYPGVPGTHMGATKLPNSSGGISLTIFFQMYGNDISYLSQDSDTGIWNQTSIPLPG